MFPKSVVAKFNDLYIPEPMSGCWIWIGSMRGNGYGRMKIKGQVYSAHRLSWMICNGKIKNGLFICHKCDNPVCVNPDHLFLGTPKDNIHDMIKKGRWCSKIADNERNKTHCKQGHRFSAENTHVYVTKTGKTHRTCRKCYKFYYQKNKKKKIQLAKAYYKKNREEIIRKRAIRRNLKKAL